MFPVPDALFREEDPLFRMRRDGWRVYMLSASPGPNQQGGEDKENKAKGQDAHLNVIISDGSFCFLL